MKKVLMMLSISLFLFSCVQDGPYKEYHDNKQLKEEGTLLNGKKEGSFKVYDDSGDLIEFGTYKEDKKVEVNTLVKEYYKSGLVKNEKFINQKKQWNGIYKSWHSPNEDDYENVIFVESSEDRKHVLESEIPYQNGKKHGLEKNWDDKGELHWETIYFQGDYIISLYSKTFEHYDGKYITRVRELLKNGGESYKYSHTSDYDFIKPNPGYYKHDFWVFNRNIDYSDFTIFPEEDKSEEISEEDYNNLERFSEEDKKQLVKEILSKKTFSDKEKNQLQVNLMSKK